MKFKLNIFETNFPNSYLLIIVSLEILNVPLSFLFKIILIIFDKVITLIGV